MWGRKRDWEKRERINNNAAIIMSLAKKEHPAYIFIQKCLREEFS